MMVPVLSCAEIEPLTAFYCDVLGCKLRSNFSASPDNADPSHRTFEFHDSIFHLTSFAGTQGPGTVYIYIDTLDEVDVLYERIKDQPGIEMPVPLNNQSWGMREFNFVDLGGNRVCIGAQIDEVAPSYPLEDGN